MKKRVCAVIVTYNRKDYLKELLMSLLKQEYSLSGIFIFDNNSTDGTENMLFEMSICNSSEKGILHTGFIENLKVFHYRNSENSGGSGGFHDAIQMASKMEFDYLWTMDDDVLPESNCLQNLMNVISDDIRICIPSRTDERYTDYAIIRFDMKNPFKYWINSRKTMVTNDQIQGNSVRVVDMPFEGPLIDISLVKEIGLPKKDLFIIFDDTEYAQRASRVTQIHYVKNAVLHKQIIPQKTVDKLMGWKNYYALRNQIWFDSNYGENWFVRKLRPCFIKNDYIIRAVVKRKYDNIKVVRKAYVDGKRGNLGKTVMPGTAGKNF